MQEKTPDMARIYAKTVIQYLSNRAFAFDCIFVHVYLYVCRSYIVSRASSVFSTAGALVVVTV